MQQCAIGTLLHKKGPGLLCLQCVVCLAGWSRGGQARALFAEGLLPGKFDYGHHVAEAAFAAKGAA